MTKNDLKVGDIITCSDKNDMIETMLSLNDAGVWTDFIYKDEEGNDCCKLVVQEWPT